MIRYIILLLNAYVLMLLCFATESYAGREGAFSKVRKNLVTVCSQNLERYGSPKVYLRNNPQRSRSDLTRKQKALIERFRAAKCDVIAVQEVLGQSRAEAEDGAQSLAAALQQDSGRSFDSVVGDTNDRYIRVGFIFATDFLTLKGLESYTDDELPKLSLYQKPHRFVRMPLEIKLKVRAHDNSFKELNLVTFHFKSKSGGSKDPAGFLWETTRMESSEKLRELIMKKKQDALKPGGPLLILLGDRNSEEIAASAVILEGGLRLSSFQGSNPMCQLSKKARPLCKEGAPEFERIFFSVLTSDPDTADLGGTHIYRNKASWLDDILMPNASLRYALEDTTKEGDYDSGVVVEPREASDHALVYVRVAW